MTHRRIISWEDLHTVLAVCDAGAFAAAGRALQVDATTVQRRIDALEARLGVRLLERLSTGHIPTAAGERIFRTARAAEERIATLDRRLAGLDPSLEGRLRVTTTDTLSQSVLPSYLRRFRGVHPRLEINLVPGNALFTLARRDADVALRPVETPPEGLVSRPAARVAFAIYASPALLGRDPARPLATQSWVAPDHLLAGIAADRWIAANVPSDRIVARASAMTGMAALAEAGLGLTVLPCYLGDLRPGLVRAARNTLADAATTLFLVTHPDLAQSPRIVSFLDFVEVAIASDRDLFEGERPQGRN